MARHPASCRLCGALGGSDKPISARGLCEPCSEGELWEWEQDLSDITSHRYWYAARRTREALRQKMDADLLATIAANPDILATPS